MSQQVDIRFRFSRTMQSGMVNVLNENSYMMASYNQTTGVAIWHRVVPITQRASIEKMLANQYPAPASV